MSLNFLSQISWQFQSFLYEKFDKLKDKDRSDSIIYPSIYYELIYNSTIIISQQDKKLSSIFNGSIMLDFLITDISDYRISEDSFNVIWKSLLQSLFYDNVNMILSYWSTAHSVMPRDRFNISEIYGENSISEDDAKKFKSRYREFHYLLGALLLYKEKYSLLSKCIRFTLTRPALYNLVPNNKSELIDEYCKLEIGYLDMMYYEQKHPFPDLGIGVDTNDYIVMWINRYFGLLFLRQYQSENENTIYRGNDNWTELSHKKTLYELSFLEERMEILKRNVEYYLKDENKDILKELGLDIFKKETNEEYKPVKELNDFISAIVNKYKQIKKRQELDDDKVEEFKVKTKEIIKGVLSQIEKTFNKKTVAREEIMNSNYPLYISGITHYVLPKEAFTKDRNAFYENTVIIPALALVKNLKEYFASSFGKYVRKSHSVYKENLIDALDRLEISNKYTIINIGVNLYGTAPNQRLSEKISFDKERNSFSYKFIDNKEIEIINLPLSSYDSLNNSLIVIESSNLPSLVKHDIDERTIRKYKLEVLDDENLIYGSILDLNKETEISNQMKESPNAPDNLEENVWAIVAAKYELRWKKDAKATQIQIYSSYDRKGDISNLDDIKPI